MEDVLKPLCHYESRKAKKLECALDADPTHIHLLQLKSANGTFRQHAVCIYNHFLFDSNEGCLPLTKDNLSHCLGVHYGGVVRGYALVKQTKFKRSSSTPNTPSKKAKMTVTE